MSRWAEKFEKHPIHATLEQLLNWLEPNEAEIDADTEIEKRRLKKVLLHIQQTVEGLDPEYVPEDQVNQIEANLKHQHIWAQLQSFHREQTVGFLRTANDHISRTIPLVCTLSAASTPSDQLAQMREIEHAHDNFCQKTDDQLKAYAEESRKGTNAFRELVELSDKRLEAFHELSVSTLNSLKEWQTEFTNAQTSRAEDFSNAQIERGKQFDETIRGYNAQAQKETAQRAQRQQQEIERLHDELAEGANSIIEDMQEKHVSVLEIHGLVGTDGVAGGYARGAADEHSQANFWRWAAVGALVLAAAWLCLKYFMGFELTTEGGVNWSEVITASSLTAILLATAGYASHQSKIHRETEQQMRWFALEVKALDPFLSSLSSDQQKELKAQLTEKMFGQNRVTTGKGSDGIDPKSLKALSDSYLSPLKELMKLTGK